MIEKRCFYCRSTNLKYVKTAPFQISFDNINGPGPKDIFICENCKQENSFEHADELEKGFAE